VFLLLIISAGAAQPNLSTEQIKSFQIPTPPLPEQQRIVEILDKAFVAIDKAKQNAEQNLRNAKELFESYLNRIFEEKGIPILSVVAPDIAINKSPFTILYLDKSLL
jgi:type I restriction enzyme S subunit